MKTIKVGRSSGNDIVIQNDGYVGRTHCQFIQDDSGNYRVIDLNSTNGTFVNGVRRSGETRLQPNDTVRIGNTMLPWQTYFNGRIGGTVVDGGPNQPYVPPKPTAPKEEEKGCGFGVASLICGIVGANILAIIFSSVSLGRKEKNRGLATAGLVLGIIWTIILLIFLIIIFAS